MHGSLSVEQRDFVTRARRVVEPWGDIEGDLGRAEGKFDALYNQTKEIESVHGAEVSKETFLNLAEDPLLEIQTLVIDLADEIDAGLSQPRRRTSDAKRVAGLEGIVHKPVVADRLTYPDTPLGFDAVPSLDMEPTPTLTLAYLEP